MARVFGTLTGLLAMLMAGSAAAVAPDDGRLRVCHWPDYFAISFQNPKTNGLEGIDIDLARAFAEDLGAELVFVKTTFAGFMDDLEADLCDVAMFGVGVTAARDERVDFTAPYLRSDVYAIVDRAHPVIRSWADLDRDGARIVVMKGTFMEPTARDHFRFADVVTVTQFQEREAYVRSGRGDAFLTDYPYGQRMIRLSDWAKLLPPPAPIQPTDYAYAVREGASDWLAAADAFVDRIKRDGRLAEAAARHGLGEIALAGE